NLARATDDVKAGQEMPGVVDGKGGAAAEPQTERPELQALANLQVFGLELQGFIEAQEGAFVVLKLRLAMRHCRPNGGAPFFVLEVAVLRLPLIDLAKERRQPRSWRSLEPEIPVYLEERLDKLLFVLCVQALRQI